MNVTRRNVGHDCPGRRTSLPLNEMGTLPFRILLLFGVVTALLFCSSTAYAGIIFLNSTPTGVLNIPAQSYKELKFRDVIRQQFDFSCGSAAVATLLTYGYLRPTTETEAFIYMYNTGDKKLISKYGFSLLDIKRYLVSLGYTADGYRLPLSKLREMDLPAIVLIEVKGYKHFVVIKGMTDQNILIGDPARGLMMESIEHFKKLWKNKIVFVIHRGPDILITKKTFNNAQDWNVVNIGVPASVAQNTMPLSTQLLMVPGPNQFQLGGFAKIGIP